MEEAWAKAEAEGHFYSRDKFAALLRHLYNSRPGHTILLPVERIGTLIGCGPRVIGRHRTRATKLGWIEEVERYIPKVKATQYRVLKLPD